MGDYVSDSKFTLVKLHGSIDWCHWIPVDATKLVSDAAEDVIRTAPVEGEGWVINKAGSLPRSEMRYRSVPALAIPTVSKQTFICPPEHANFLREFIPQVTKIVIIGWRAAEQNFLQMLVAGLKDHPVQVVAACGDIDSANQTLDRLKAVGIEADYVAAPGGFSSFVVTRQVNRIL